MKKTLSLILVCVLLVGTMFSLTSCATKLSGSYEGEINFGVASYTITYSFKGSKVEVTRQITSMFGDTDPVVINGSYEISENEDGKMQITLTYNAEDEVIDGGTFDFEKGDDYIKIGAVKYTKVKK